MSRMTPNLFIPGAAKCGTTSLYAILSQHPEIHVPEHKEPTFFTWPYQFIKNPLEYFRFFDSQKPYRLDASANYLTSEQTPAVLANLFPDARFVIILRHPKARAYSLYRFMRYIGAEIIPRFAEALKVEGERYASTNFFSNCMIDPWNYFYCRSCLYDEQLARYLAVFRREQIFVTTLADLSKEPISTTDRVLRFLELDSAPAKTFKFEVKNRLEHSFAPYDGESDRVMTVAFDGVTERTDRLLGQTLDWSL